MLSNLSGAVIASNVRYLTFRSDMKMSIVTTLMSNLVIITVPIDAIILHNIL